MSTFVTHASIRVKGTENIYEPTLCMDINCSKKLSVHMHCPFCERKDSYTDPVILKAHYRVKHVDKGIDFAGLKIVRCCEHCDIIGSIKGSKEIKGAHWHCYRCKNGFNRRDEAIKHYRTHFRNPQTTFQIQITQDVNQVFSKMQKFVGSIGVGSDGTTIDGDKFIQVSVAANETVDTSGTDIHTMLILEQDVATIDKTMTNSTGDDGTTVVDLNDEACSSPYPIDWTRLTSGFEPEQCSVELQRRLEQLLAEKEAAMNQLRADRDTTENQLRLRIRNLEQKVSAQEEEIATLQRREVELVGQVSVTLDDQIVQLVSRLKADHEMLLHTQLAKLSRQYVPPTAPLLQSDHQQPNSASPIFVFESISSCDMSVGDGSTGMTPVYVLATTGKTLKEIDLSDESFVVGSVLSTEKMTISESRRVTLVDNIKHKDGRRGDERVMVEVSLDDQGIGESYDSQEEFHVDLLQDPNAAAVGYTTSSEIPGNMTKSRREEHDDSLLPGSKRLRQS